ERMARAGAKAHVSAETECRIDGESHLDEVPPRCGREEGQVMAPGNWPRGGIYASESLPLRTEMTRLLMRVQADMKTDAAAGVSNRLDHAGGGISKNVVARVLGMGSVGHDKKE